MAFWALDTQHEIVYTDLPSPSSMKGKMSRAFQNRPNRHPVILIYNLNLNKRQNPNLGAAPQKLEWKTSFWGVFLYGEI